MVILVLVVMILLEMVVIVLVFLSQVKYCHDAPMVIVLSAGMVVDSDSHLSEVAVKCELLKVVLDRSH